MSLITTKELRDIVSKGKIHNEKINIARTTQKANYIKNTWDIIEKNLVDAIKKHASIGIWKFCVNIPDIDETIMGDNEFATIFNNYLIENSSSRYVWETTYNLHHKLMLCSLIYGQKMNQIYNNMKLDCGYTESDNVHLFSRNKMCDCNGRFDRKMVILCDMSCYANSI